MHHKDFKHKIRKQLKKLHPNWHRLTKKEKKAIALKVLDEVVQDHDFKQPVETPKEEQTSMNSCVPT